jgi:putative oxidoreductase
MTDVSTPVAPRSHSILASIIDKLIALCALIPYALVALGLRMVMAGVFFLSGQSKIEGPSIPLRLGIFDLDLTVVLPAQIKPETFRIFETQYAGLPISPDLAAYLFSFAEFVLPLCLMLGFATRFAAIALLVMTLLLQAYVMPTMLWSTHIYWAAILLVLVSVGPGAISFDALIRHVHSRE